VLSQHAFAKPYGSGKFAVSSFALVEAAVLRYAKHDREKPALGLDPRVGTGFPKRSCFIKMLQRITDSL
jgi:hypothetical protein